MTNPNQIAAAAPQTLNAPSELDRLLQQPYSPREALTSDKLDRMIRVAEIMASGKTTVPKHLQGSIGDCMAVVTQAMAWNANPFAVAQKTHLVNGVLGYESQLIGAVLNSSGAIRESALMDEYFGEWSRVIGKYKELPSKFKEGETYRKLATTPEDEKGVGIRVWGTLAGEREPRLLELLLSQAQVRNSTLWADDPKQQLFYLAQKRWARKYAPGVILGLYSPDELERPHALFDADPDTGEILPLRPPEKPALPPYSDEAFEKNLPAWTKLVESRKKTAVDLLSMLSTKAAFSDEQRAAILALGKPELSSDNEAFVAEMNAAEEGAQ